MIGARSRQGRATLDLSGVALGRRSGRARARSRHRRLRRTDGRRRRSAPSRGRSRARRRQAVVTANKALLARHGVALAALAEKHGVGAQFRGRGRRRHPDRQDAARGPRRQFVRARLRHPQRHLQLHPHPHGAGAAVLRRMPQGGAAARLCRGRSDLRHRRLRHRPQARDPDQPRLRHRGRSRGDLRRGHLVDHAATISRPPTNSATASSCSAWRSAPSTASSSACIRPWCRKDSAIAEVDGRDQCGRDRRRRHRRRSRSSGPGAGGEATASAVVADIVDIARGVRVAPFGRPVGAARPTAAARADAAPRRRLLHPPARRRPAGHRSPTIAQAHGRREDFARNRSCSAIAAAGRTAATIRAAPAARRRSC